MSEQITFLPFKSAGSNSSSKELQRSRTEEVMFQQPERIMIVDTSRQTLAIMKGFLLPISKVCGTTCGSTLVDQRQLNQLERRNTTLFALKQEETIKPFRIGIISC